MSFEIFNYTCMSDGLLVVVSNIMPHPLTLPGSIETIFSIDQTTVETVSKTIRF
jgi:hypothetical protein